MAALGTNTLGSEFGGVPLGLEVGDLSSGVSWKLCESHKLEI